MAKGQGKTDYFLYADCILASNLTPNAKMICFVIANHYNWTKKTATWVSIPTIAKEASISESTARRIIKQLLAEKWLEHAGFKVVNNGYVNEFRPNVHKADRAHLSNSQAGLSNEAITPVKWEEELTGKQITNIEIYRTKKKEQLNNNASTKFSLPPLRWLRKKEIGN